MLCPVRVYWMEMVMKRILVGLVLLMTFSANFAGDVPSFMAEGRKVYLQLSTESITGVYEILKVDGTWIYAKRWDGVRSWRNTTQIKVVFDCQTDRDHIKTLLRGNCG